MTLAYIFLGFFCVNLFGPPLVSSQQAVKIDDGNTYSPANPNGIQFSSSGWSTVNSGDLSLRYGGSYTWSDTVGANLVFFFRGTQITHYADKGAFRGPVGVSVDGELPINVTWTNTGGLEYQKPMWTRSGLTQGDHQVVITNEGGIDKANSIIGVDYFEVTSSDGNIVPTMSGPGASTIPPNAVLVDDGEPSITYTGTWKTYASYARRGVYLGGTSRASTSASAMITFKFSGTAVWYFTEAYPQNARVSISIDGSPGELVNTASLANIWRTQSLFWGKGGLSDGPHVVTVSHAGAEGTYIGVDFFKYLPSPGTAATSGASASPTTSSSAAPTASPKPFPVGAVVGGVIGGITVLGLFLFLFLLRRRRQTPQPDVSGHYPYTDDTTQGAHTPKFNDGHPADFPGAYPPMQTVAYQAPATATNIQYVAQTQNSGVPNFTTPLPLIGGPYRGHPELS